MPVSYSGKADTEKTRRMMAAQREQDTKESAERAAWLKSLQGKKQPPKAK